MTAVSCMKVDNAHKVERLRRTFCDYSALEVRTKSSFSKGRYTNLKGPRQFNCVTIAGAIYVSKYSNLKPIVYGGQRYINWFLTGS